eukprot:GHVN01019832.1.p1 GENE.GHVN01019832.1~~GHVN01019832.1.p1  ORF type:complete len:952 (+),score=74.13 GHVN01019832.1:249-3104(+)
MRHLLVYTPVDMTAALTIMLLIIYVYDGYVTPRDLFWGNAVMLCRTVQVVVSFVCYVVISVSKTPRVDKYVFGGLLSVCQFCTILVSSINYPGDVIRNAVPIEMFFGWWVYIYTGYPIFISVALGGWVMAWELLFNLRRVLHSSAGAGINGQEYPQNPLVTVVYTLLTNVIGITISYRVFSMGMELLHAEKDAHSTQYQNPHVRDLEVQAVAVMKQNWASKGQTDADVEFPRDGSSFNAQLTRLALENFSLVQCEQVASDIGSYRRIGSLGTKLANNKWAMVERVSYSPVRVADSPMSHKGPGGFSQGVIQEASPAGCGPSLRRSPNEENVAAYTQRLGALTAAFDIAVENLQKRIRAESFNSGRTRRSRLRQRTVSQESSVSMYLREEKATRRLIHEANTHLSGQLILQPGFLENPRAQSAERRRKAPSSYRINKYLKPLFKWRPWPNQTTDTPTEDPKAAKRTPYVRPFDRVEGSYDSLSDSPSERLSVRERNIYSTRGSSMNTRRRSSRAFTWHQDRDCRDSCVRCWTCVTDYACQMEVVSFFSNSKFVSDCASWLSRPHMPERNKWGQFSDSLYERWFTDWWSGMNVPYQNSAAFVHLFGFILNIVLMVTLEFGHNRHITKDHDLKPFMIKLGVFSAIEVALGVSLVIKKTSSSSLMLNTLFPTIVSIERLTFSFHHLIVVVVKQSTFDFNVYGILALNCSLVPLNRFVKRRVARFVFVLSWILANSFICIIAWASITEYLDVITRLNVVFLQLFLFLYHLFFKAQDQSKRHLFCLTVLPYLIILRDCIPRKLEDKGLQPIISETDANQSPRQSNEPSHPNPTPVGEPTRGEVELPDVGVIDVSLMPSFDPPVISGGRFSCYVESDGSARKRQRDGSKDSLRLRSDGSVKEDSKLQVVQTMKTSQLGETHGQAFKLREDGDELYDSHSPTSDSVALFIEQPAELVDN